jgi:lysozyme
MLDLSNNNGPASNHDFKLAHKAGHFRAYCKVTQGKSFVDQTYADYKKDLQAAGFKVGGYHFADNFDQDPRDQANFFLEHLGPIKRGADLRPCLDLEQGTATPAIGKWATGFIAQVWAKTRVKPLLYSYASYLESCQFKSPEVALWLAAYGANDGKEHDCYTPHPWTSLAAHQYTSKGLVPGIKGQVDVSHVLKPNDIDIKRWWI